MNLLPLVLALAPILVASDDAVLKPVTVIGTVIDTGCYMVHDGIGQEHRKCASECAKKGVPLAIVDSAGKVYLPLAVDHKNQNARLMTFIEQKVKVTGTLVERGGMSGIAMKTIELAK